MSLHIERIMNGQSARDAEGRMDAATLVGGINGVITSAMLLEKPVVGIGMFVSTVIFLCESLRQQKNFEQRKQQEILEKH